MSGYRLIDAENTHHPVSQLARVLGVARAGCYAWACRPPSPRALADQALVGQIGQIHARSRGTYGAHASTPSCAWAWASGSPATASPASWASTAGRASTVGGVVG